MRSLRRRSSSVSVLCLCCSPNRRFLDFGVQCCISSLAFFHNAFSVSNVPAAVLLGTSIRLLTLPLSTYGSICVARMGKAIPELQDAYLQYASVAHHPKAIGWEKKVVREKLKKERSRIFRAYRTSNVHLYAFSLMATGLNAYFALSSNLGLQLISTASFVDPTSAFVVHVILPLGAAISLTTFNTTLELRRRKGLTASADKRVDLAQKYLVGTSLVSFSALLVGLYYQVVSPLLPYVLLGMSSCGLLQSATMTFPLTRIILAVPERPTADTADESRQSLDPGKASALHLAFEELDQERAMKDWFRVKAMLNYDADVKIRSLFRKVGLINQEGDIEEDRIRFRERLRQIQEEKSKTSSGEKNQS